MFAYLPSIDLWLQNQCIHNKGWCEKKFHNSLPINAEMIDPRVKSQARCQFYFPRALKWDIVHLYTLNIST